MESYIMCLIHTSEGPNLASLKSQSVRSEYILVPGENSLSHYRDVQGVKTPLKAPADPGNKRARWGMLDEHYPSLERTDISLSGYLRSSSASTVVCIQSHRQTIYTFYESRVFNSPTHKPKTNKSSTLFLQPLRVKETTHNLTIGMLVDLCWLYPIC